MREDEVGINRFGAGEQKSERVAAKLESARLMRMCPCWHTLSVYEKNKQEKIPWAPLSASLIVLHWPLPVLKISAGVQVSAVR